MNIDFNDPKIKELFTNPLKWAETFLRNPMDSEKPLRLKSYQREILEATRDNRRIVLRYGRRMGKTVALCVDTLWWVAASPLVHMMENGLKKQQKIKVLIATPYETQIKMIWNMYLSLINDSPLLQDQLVKVRTSDVHVLEFDNGSVIEGYTIGISSSNKGTSLRGLDANVLFIDEMDAIPREIIDEVLMPIWTGHPDCKLRVSSTPTGKRELFYEWCFCKSLSVNTLQGLQEIQTIKNGDYVFGEDGYAEKVITTYKQPYTGTVKLIKTALGELKCTPNHEIKLLDVNFTRADQIKVGDYVSVPVEKHIPSLIELNTNKYITKREEKRLNCLAYSKDHTKAETARMFFGSTQMRRHLYKYQKDKKKYGDLWPFDNRKRQNLIQAQEFLASNRSEDLYKLLGFYLAEGNILKDFSRKDYSIYSGIQFTFNKSEIEYISECADLIYKLFGKTPKILESTKDNSTMILLYSSWVSYVFIELCGEYSDKKRINSSILGSSHELWILKNFIKGDGTGSFEGQFTFTSTSKILANQLAQLSYKYDAPVGLYTRKAYLNHKESYQCTRISKFVKKYYGMYWVRVNKIRDEFYDDYVYNLETERTHTYNVHNLCTHNCTRSEELGWWHRHYPSWHPDNDRWISIEQAKEMGMPIYDSTEGQVKSTTPSDAYAREYGAEFGEEYGGVYKHHLINASLVKYGRNIPVEDSDVFAPNFPQKSEHKYIIGVDWNSYVNGGQIVLLEYCTTPTIVTYYDDDISQDVTIDFTNKYRLFYRRGIKSKESTQRMTRAEIIRLLQQFKIDYVYVDYGAGDTNIEELSLVGRKHPELELQKKLRVIDSGATTEHWDHISRQKVKKRNKSLMVNFSVLSLEEHMFILPKEEDQPTRLVGQLRGYRVKNITARGEFSYEGEDHILDAFNLAIYGFQQNFGDILRQTFIQNLISVSDPRMAYYPRREMKIENTPIKNHRFNGIVDPEKEQYYLNKHLPKRVQMPAFGRRDINFSTGAFGNRSF